MRGVKSEGLRAKWHPGLPRRVPGGLSTMCERRASQGTAHRLAGAQSQRDSRCGGVTRGPGATCPENLMVGKCERRTEEPGSYQAVIADKSCPPVLACFPPTLPGGQPHFSLQTPSTVLHATLEYTKLRGLPGSHLRGFTSPQGTHRQ